jgi:hypothetical protein
VVARSVDASPDDASPDALWYALYGLRFRSTKPLTLKPVAPSPQDEADCIVTWANPGDAAPEPDGPVVAGLPCDGPCHNGAMVFLVSRGPGGTWFWYDALGTIHVHADGRRADVYPQVGFDERALQLVVVGQIATFVLHTLGYPSLHASAIVMPRGAVAFLGPSGQGKSTAAACFLRRGATLLTDDVLPLRDEAGEIRGVPSFPLMKISTTAAEVALGAPHDLPYLPTTRNKKLLSLGQRWAFAAAPTRIGAVYLLDRRDPAVAGTAITIRRLSGIEALRTLLTHTSNRAYLAPRENAELPPLYARLLAQARIAILSYPNGFEHHTALHERIVRDLEAE